MKNLLLFGPFLWLRRIVLFVLVLAIILGLALFFVANSPLVIKKVADTFAPDYNISYDSIKGNALTGVEIENPQFKDKPLAKNIVLKWNPNTLVAKKITVDKLYIDDADVDVIKSLIASFETDDNASESNGSDFTVQANNINLSTKPFNEKGIHISKARVKSEMLEFTSDGLTLQGFELELDTNVTKIFLKGHLEKQVITLEDTKIKDVNITALEKLFVDDGNETAVTGNDEVGQPSPFIPKMLLVKKLETNLLPVTYDPVKIQQIQLQAKELRFDVENLVLENVVMDVNGSTNLSNAIYCGTIVNNHLSGNIRLTPNNRLYELYKIPLRKEAIGEIVVDFNASKERVRADVRSKARHILQNKKGEFNIDIDDLLSHVDYDINSSKLIVESKAMVTTPYAKDIRLTNHFTMDEDIRYEGEIKAKELRGIEAKFTKPLQNLFVAYSGTEKSIQTILTSQNIKGKFDSKDFKSGELHLETIEALMVDAFVELPKELEETKVNVTVDAPIDFNHLSVIDAQVKVLSNVANIDADVKYGKAVEVQAKLDIPQDSLLKAFNKDVKWEGLSPMDAHVTMVQNDVTLKLKTNALNVDMKYALDKETLKGKLNLAGFVSDVSGNIKKKLKIQTKIKSLSALSESISTLYPLEALPPIEGVIDTTLSINEMKTAELVLSSPKVTYKADRKTKHIIKDVKLVASVDASKVMLKSYKATFNEQKYFSSKPAVIALGDNIEVSNLWVNDTLKVSGNYHTINKKGSFVADAKNFHIKDKMADIQTEIHLNVGLDGNDTTVTGKIILLKGSISPTVQGRTFASDSDIIIMQEMSKKKSSPFMDNLALTLKIETKEALRLKQRPMNIRLKPDFSINKDKGSPMLYLGSVELVKGGTYIFQEKKFTLGKSFVYFTGDVNKPLLDIKANYKSINHLITILVTGTPAEPNINFSSSPSLSREQILSVILFDSEAGGDTHSGEDMMKMMGGAMAKSALADAGVKVDHLAFGEGNSIEVGKKLTNKITVIYVNAEVPKVRLKYEHNKRTESVIEVNEESQSYDIIYKRDF